MESLWESQVAIDRTKQSEALELLSQYLGLESPELIEKCLWLLDQHSQVHQGERVEAFVRFFIKKKSGGRREILAPVEPLKGLLRTILFELLSRYPLARFAHGFRKNRSAITNAMAHFKPLEGLAVAYGINWDIQDCFPSTDLNMIRKVFHRTIGDDLLSEGVSKDVVIGVIDILTHLTTFQYGRAKVPVLPMGAPTSPALLNLMLRAFDLRVARRLRVLGREHDTQYTYTRYGDDITVTSPDPLPQDVVSLAPSLLQRFGYRVNRKKTELMMRGGSLPPIIITGLVVGKDKLMLSDKWLKVTEMMLTRYLTQQGDPEESEYNKLRGRLGLARAISKGSLPKRLENCFRGALFHHGSQVEGRVKDLLHGKSSDDSHGDVSVGYDVITGEYRTEEEWEAYAAWLMKLSESDPETADRLLDEVMQEHLSPDHPDCEKTTE